MQSIKIIPFLIISLAICSCSTTATEENQFDTDLKEEVVEEVIQYEESAPDSGLLNDVNPEEIITDDWSDDGDLELETEQ